MENFTTVPLCEFLISHSQILWLFLMEFFVVGYAYSSEVFFLADI